jgi:hypothetical protein
VSELTLGTFMSMRVEGDGGHGASATRTTDGLQWTGGIMRLEVASVDAELARPLTSVFVLSTFHTQLAHHPLHERVGRQTDVRKLRLAGWTLLLGQLVDARTAHHMACTQAAWANGRVSRNAFGKLQDERSLQQH